MSDLSPLLPAPQFGETRQLLRDPYSFHFLTLGDDAHGQDLEKGLLAHAHQFLLELGAGFAFVVSQYHLQVRDSDFYTDLLPEAFRGVLPTIQELEAEFAPSPPGGDESGDDDAP